MSASSSGSFQSSLYLLAVSMTLAAVYLGEPRKCSGQGGAVDPGKDNCSRCLGPPAAPGAPSRTRATHRLMELRLREPDFRFRVVQTMRSVNRKRDRSFLPPTAFCGAQHKTEARPPALRSPGDSQAQGEAGHCPTCQRQRQLGPEPGLLLGRRSSRPTGGSRGHACK